jgi:hypothetical protein
MRVCLWYQGCVIPASEWMDCLLLSLEIRGLARGSHVDHGVSRLPGAAGLALNVDTVPMLADQGTS